MILVQQSFWRTHLLARPRPYRTLGLGETHVSFNNIFLYFLDHKYMHILYSFSPKNIQCLLITMEGVICPVSNEETEICILKKNAMIELSALQLIFWDDVCLSILIKRVHCRNALSYHFSGCALNVHMFCLISVFNIMSVHIHRAIWRDSTDCEYRHANHCSGHGSTWLRTWDSR